MVETLEITQLGNPVLRQIAQPVDNIQAPNVQFLIQQMLATLQQANGVGIAAPQVGHSQQIIIIASRSNPRYPHAPEMEPTPMINPRLLSHSDQVVKDWEGCLSIPGIRGPVPRFQSVEVEYIGPDGKVCHRELTDFVARIFQHEYDHLQGFVFLDRVESVQELVTEQEYLQRVVQS
jgi:peptide deformylase